MALRPVPPPKVRIPRGKYWDRLDEAVDRIAGPLARAIEAVVLEHLGDVTETTYVELADIVRRGDFVTLDRRLDLGALWVKLSERLERRQIQAIKWAINEEMVGVPTVALDFDFEDQRLFRDLARLRLDTVQDLDKSSRRAIRAALLTTRRQGLGPAAAARHIRHAIGLTERQTVALANFEAGLRAAQAGDVSVAAVRGRWTLSRGIVRSERAFASDAAIAQSVQEYRDRLLKYRATVIAEHETTRAMSAGRQRYWRFLQERGEAVGLVQTWLVTPDERTCNICMPLHNAEAPIGQSFPGGFDGPPAHVRCRCVTILDKPRGERRGNEYTRAANRRVDEIQEQRGIEPVQAA